MQHEDAGNPSGPLARYLVIQLARFGDLIQTKRLLVSLMACGEVHLLVDRSLMALARLAFPGVRVHGIAAHGIHGPAILGLVRDDLQELQADQFHRIYNLNYSGLNFALAGLFPVGQVRGYRLDQGQRVVDAWPAQAMRWTKVRTTRGLNLVDVWGLYADQPVDPERVNPAASSRGPGLGVVMAGQNARRSLPPRVLAPLVHAARQRIGHGPILLLGA
ncbi:MAG: glycosyltransferase family 9 protein, partial [Desulfovibrionales bacterium]|nr:glycosyltransferase family 9 protein [Desulfovibrionales bacterium]